MVRACLVFPLVVIVCAGSAIALKCYECRSNATPCDMTKPGEEKDCANDVKHCWTAFDPNGSPNLKGCLSDLDYDGAIRDFTIPVGKCFASAQNSTACFCEEDLCNGASKKDEATKAGGGSSSTKPNVWTNLLWIGLVLASAFYSRMRDV